MTAECERWRAPSSLPEGAAAWLLLALLLAAVLGWPALGAREVAALLVQEEAPPIPPTTPPPPTV